MPWDINGLHRRPPGSRLLVYLDQSARSCLAAGQLPDLLSVLRRGRETGLLVCPESIEHSNETVLIPSQYHQAIVDLGDELAMGIHLQDREEVWRNEVMAAAASFCGMPPPMEVFREAFSADPHTPIKVLFPGGFRVSVKSAQTEWHREEAQSPKDLSLDLQPFFEASWARDSDFDGDCEETYLANIKTKLWPLVDPEGFVLWLGSAAAEAQQELTAGLDIGRTGSAFNRFVYREKIGAFSKYLVEAFGCLKDRRVEFLASSELRACPIISFEVLLLTALLAVPGRKAKAGDLYDLRHLSLGLSRCDIVTTDGSMAEMCRSRRLVPDGVGLYSSREFDALTNRLEEHLAKQAGG